MIRRIDLVTSKVWEKWDEWEHGGRVEPRCDVCITPIERMSGPLSHFRLVYLCDDHLPLADLLIAARALKGLG